MLKRVITFILFFMLIGINQGQVQKIRIASIVIEGNKTAELGPWSAAIGLAWSEDLEHWSVG